MNDHDQGTGYIPQSIIHTHNLIEIILLFVKDQLIHLEQPDVVPGCQLADMFGNRNNIAQMQLIQIILLYKIKRNLKCLIQIFEVPAVYFDHIRNIVHPNHLLF
ncbi:hypothetical protein D3C73_1396970 [compost metagenome]